MNRAAAHSIIRFNNFMQLLSCICDILAIFIRDLRGRGRLPHSEPAALARLARFADASCCRF
jgi:hypothetical protein